jgi:TRAP-type C4-dicarboxylate transport system permease small subunit
LKLLALVGFCAFTMANAATIVGVMARNGQVSITAGVPMTIPYAAFVVGFGLIVAAAIAGALERRLRASKAIPPEH